MKVIIYSPVDVFYYSFYIEGLYRLYGKENVKFSMAGFPPFASRILAAKILESDRESKIVIDALDTSTIYDIPLEWCNVYGKVNYNRENLPVKNKEKLVAVGPGFGIRIWSFPRTVFMALTNYLKSRVRIHDKKYFFTSYWRQYRRLPLQVYQNNAKVRDNYVYFMSSLWEKEMQTNSSRASFIEACKDSNEIDFEGGFAPRSDNKTLGFSSSIGKRVAPNIYIWKIKKSFVTFNTPAVQGCHGWKLAEFLAMGKAIISTDLNNVLPAPLENRKHLHFVTSTKEEIKKALKEISGNEEYRKHLENNSRNYFNQHLDPVKVISKILKYSK
ncbi:glycosyltransferase [Salinimicrobium terrae]|uniref:glycosyltransferase n=1 Tax=Salinimicrobium terrae TaxID=470866 RepID=UPI0004284D75|nr:hypothetical protein [Salinimicrobium terrae]